MALLLRYEQGSACSEGINNPQTSFTYKHINHHIWLQDKQKYKWAKRLLIIGWLLWPNSENDIYHSHLIQTNPQKIPETLTHMQNQ